MPSEEVIKKNKDIGKRIALRREELGLTQDELADLVGYKSASKRSTIQKIESGRSGVKQSMITKFATALQTTKEFIMGWDESDDDIVKFPVIGDIAAGYDGSAVEEYTGDEIGVPRSWLRGRQTTDFFMLRVKGDSMFPEYQSGDYILVKRQTTLDRSGQVGVVIYEDDNATLKKVEYVDGENWMKLIPLNPSYPPIMIENEALEHCCVLGYPVKLIRDVKN